MIDKVPEEQPFMINYLKKTSVDLQKAALLTASKNIQF